MAGHSLRARAGERPLAGRRQRGHVADRSAARERAAHLPVEADELAHPPDGLALDLGGGAGVDRQVDVVTGRKGVADGADLEPARADEREVPRPRLRDALVEDPSGIVQDLVDG
jgi:hypothetical protein